MVNYSNLEKVNGVLESIDSIRHIVEIEYVDIKSNFNHDSIISFGDILNNDQTQPTFEQLPFDYPLFIMYSSELQSP